MKNLIVIALIVYSGAVLSANFVDSTVLMQFDKIDTKSKIITFSGKPYKYNLMGMKEYFLDKNNKYKKLKYLRQGEKLFVIVRTQNKEARKDLTGLDRSRIIYIGKNKAAF